MNLSRRGLHRKTLQAYLHKVVDACELTATASESPSGEGSLQGSPESSKQHGYCLRWSIGDLWTELPYWCVLHNRALHWLGY